jgi:hypothetical protein
MKLKKNTQEGSLFKNISSETSKKTKHSRNHNTVEKIGTKRHLNYRKAGHGLPPES